MSYQPRSLHTRQQRVDPIEHLRHDFPRQYPVASGETLEQVQRPGAKAHLRLEHERLAVLEHCARDNVQLAGVLKL